MHENTKTILVILSLILVATLAVFGYPKYKIWKETKENLAINEKAFELNRLIVESHDCKKVLAEAATLVKIYNKAEPIWIYKGACEFDTMDFAAAKISFQKVLALNPENEVAKNYLAKMEIKPGEIVLSAQELPFDQTLYETETGLKFSDPLHLDKVVSRPASIPLYLTATYSSPKKFDAVVAYLKKILPEGYHFNLLRNNTYAIFDKGDDGKLVIIKVERTSSVIVTVNYRKLK